MSGRDADIVRLLRAWFAAHARDLPWRAVGADGRRDAYAALVAECMLQQTQVARVLERFAPFIERFPTADALARAPEDDVLAAWAGLGYYRRARMLQGAARAIAERFGGRVPDAAADLRSLPGVGRYTAGAIASIVFGHCEPIVDGNVRRVLARLEARADATPANDDWAWTRAGELVAQAGAGVGAATFNEGLMELGATVCTPKAPRCGACPLASVCAARAAGSPERFPAPKAPAARRSIWCATLVLTDPAGRLLVEQRPGKGLWASMWQCPTIESPDAPPGAPALAGHAGVPEAALRPVGAFRHTTTHRDVEFEVYAARVAAARAGASGRRWVAPEDLSGVALSNAQHRAIGLSRERGLFDPPAAG